MRHSLSALFVAVAAAVAPSAFAAGVNLGQEPPADLIVTVDGLEWVYAAPCAGESPSCGLVHLSHGFQFATDAQWNASFASVDALVAAFTDGGLKCASPYFSIDYDHCDLSDAQGGYIWHSPLAPDASRRDHPAAETFLVRAGNVPEPETLALMLTGLGLGTLVGRRRQRQQQS